MKNSKNIFLVGMPGAGKSTLGKQLANLMKRDFIDLDDVIEDQMEMSITSIFSKLGESQFRVAEARALDAVLIESNHVIGTGGGTSCYFDNMKKMNDHGITVFLNPPVGTLAQRIKADFKDRPKLSGAGSLLDVLKNTYSDRVRYYNQSQFILDNPDLSAEEVLQVLESKSKG